jgi:acyl carrier protein
MTDFLEKLSEIISQALGVEKDKVSLEANLYSDFNASRLEVADLLAVCQEKLKISLPQVKIEKIKTVADLVKLLEENSDEL